MGQSLRLLKRERASDSVHQILRESILTRVFAPGQRLKVQELANKLGVSLTPVKDAIHRLSAEGLIEISPRSGTYVVNLDVDEVAETFEIRAALECLAAEKLTERLTDQHMDKFRELMADMERPVHSDKERTFHERKNLEFHNFIVELSGNRRLIKLYQNLNAHIQIAFIHSSRQGWIERMENEKQEHREIFSAIQARDSQRLNSALREHILRSSQNLVNDLEKQLASV